MLTFLLACTPPDYPELEAPPPPPRVTVDLDGGVSYHGVYPGGQTGWEDDITDADVATYVAATGHEVAWVYASHNWFNGHAFPDETVAMIQARGSVPWIRLMLRSELDEVTGADPEYSLERIRAGDFDADLEAWGAAAAQVQGPLIVEWGTEMNEDWFAWNARHHGNDGGAELFAQTYQHLVATIARGGADNLTWVFHVNDSNSPDRSWNTIERYDPGPEVCPWVAVSVYGQQVPTETDWWSFRTSLDLAYPGVVEVAAGRPILLAEFGVTAGSSGDPVQWADAALTDLLDERWPEIHGFSWWNETWENDDDPSHDTEMRVAQIPGMSELFEQALSRGVTERATVLGP